MNLSYLISWAMSAVVLAILPVCKLVFDWGIIWWWIAPLAIVFLIVFWIGIMLWMIKTGAFR